MRRIAHRGRVDDWPENVIESISSALAETDGLEVDVRLSADGVPILMHDPDLDRTTDGTGPIDALTADELAQRAVQGSAPVPRLADYLEAADVHDAPLVLLDLKDPTDACLEATVAACEGFPQERLLLAARTDAALQALRALVPTARLASLGVTVGTVDARIAGAQACAAEALFIHHGDAAYERHRSAVATIRSNGRVAGASTLRTVRAVSLAETDGCGFALVDLPLTTSEELS
jgi:glycerophosphoryl diester phosphodiesterase